MKKAIVLLSGGLDSATALYKAKNDGFDEIYAISFLYGQKHTKEITSAKQIANLIGVKEHKLVELRLDNWGGSSLTDDKINVDDTLIDGTNIPVTYVPARNMVFLSVAASYADAIGATDIYIGVSQVDYSGYVDCRDVFIKSMEETINFGTVLGAEKQQRVKIHAPFMNMKKSEEIKLGIKLGVDYSLTWTCYNGFDKPCGKCESCRLRGEAFKEAGYDDPLMK